MRQVAQYVSADLPPPISANAIWRAHVVKGQVRNIKSLEYRKWIDAAGYMLNTQNLGRVEGPYGLTILVPKKCRIDLDNAVKAVSDVLQLHGVVDNDRLCQRLEVRKGDGETTRVMVVSTREA